MRFGQSWGQRARGVRGGLWQLWGADGRSEEPAGCQGVARRSLAGVGGGAQGGNSTTSVGPPRPSPPRRGHVSHGQPFMESGRMQTPRLEGPAGRPEPPPRGCPVFPRLASMGWTRDALLRRCLSTVHMLGR